MSIAITIPLLIVAVYVEEVKRLVETQWERLWGGQTNPVTEPKEGTSAPKLAGQRPTSSLDKTDQPEEADLSNPQEENPRDQEVRWSRLWHRGPRRSAKDINSNRGVVHGERNV